MHLNFLGQSYFGLGSFGNTGDGIRLAGDIGADFWHMNAVAATFGYKVPEFECAFYAFDALCWIYLMWIRPENVS